MGPGRAPLRNYAVAPREGQKDRVLLLLLLLLLLLWPGVGRGGLDMDVDDGDSRPRSRERERELYGVSSDNKLWCNAQSACIAIPAAAQKV